ncbi:Protein takeout [Frankliniella fusca]|uniref:Protein takeout n=1 Tax=Frankliniella fusca TaxID=407009 RepID=A0AAE1LP41_9NEOP|nr:Protein takeout [Frankliniella fusca]
MALLRLALSLAALTLAALGPHRAGAVNKLPSYMSACSIKDPKINECVVRNGRAAIPHIINGEPKYRVPNMNPLVIPELALWQGTSAVGLKLAWKNAEIDGLKDAEFLACDMNVTSKHTKLTFFVPTITITGKYTASGRVLLLPVTGTGPSNITVKDMKISYEYDWPLKKKPNGREHIDILNSKMTLHSLGFMSMRFENLFNGDRLLGENMNNFINENWQEISKEFGPGVADAIGEVFQLVMKNICDAVPYDVVFNLN